MSVAMPTAMPDAPLSNTCGSRDGSSFGSLSVPSKFWPHSTVPCSSSDSSDCANRASLASVYRIAANCFGSSGEPQFPCPSMSG
jgi:hypothetical protein